jgi:hypothetical protein
MKPCRTTERIDQQDWRECTTSWRVYHLADLVGLADREVQAPCWDHLVDLADLADLEHKR